jgi:hypothetical protein
LIAVIFIACIGLSSATANEPTEVKQQEKFPILPECKADLAKRLKLQPQDISLANAEPIVWSDAALGMPEIDKMYAQVKTPGHKMILKARNRLYLYATSDKVYRYGGPLRVWSYSMLYLKPIPNEPNLNFDLYQCSLLGTNNFRVASGVTDYYPQGKGTIIFK